MAVRTIAEAMQRAESVYRRRPSAALQADAPATSSWQGGTRVVAAHAAGFAVATDMPVELGGSGDQVSPGWLFRAGLANCAATCIAMQAAAEGVELTVLQLSAHSRSDVRGLLGMREPDGTPVYCGLQDLRLQICAAARQVAAQPLRELIERGLQQSPIYIAMRGAVAVSIEIDPT